MVALNASIEQDKWILTVSPSDIIIDSAMLDQPDEDSIIQDFKNSAPITRYSFALLFWSTINIIATVGIVFVNKSIFQNQNLKQMPACFAAFHFLCTSIALYFMKFVGKLTIKFISVWKVLPLCLVFCANIMLTNLSLAYTPVLIYQVSRVLMTPTIAIFNRLLFNARISDTQMYAIVQICCGIVAVAFFDAQNSIGEKLGSAGLFFSGMGVIMGSLYSISIGAYIKRYSMSSMQLLFNEAPIAFLMLLCVIPFSDTISSLNSITMDLWGLILVSGLLATLVNISLFFIIERAGALTSTVVGHFKTCAIVFLGWLLGEPMSTLSMLGMLLTISGILRYSNPTSHRKTQSK
jgi:solute carrier family 35 protein E3